MSHFLKLSLVVWLLSCFQLQAQQQAMYSQYMYNSLAINPAYAGSQESLSMTALMREQWVGMEGAPSTQTFAAHMPVEKQRFGLGLLMMHDKIGITDQTSVYWAYAYKIPFSNGDELSMGLQAGFTHYKASYSEVSVTDPAFQSGDVSEYHPNFGAGLFYHSDKYYFGLSVPQILESNIDKENMGSATKLVRHYFLQSGYVFDLGTNLKLKPNMLIGFVEGAPLELDLNLNMYFYELMGLGASWRSGDAIVLLLQVQITNKLQFGYAYDFGTAAIRRVSSGTHELFLNYRISFVKDRIITPRYF